MGTYYRGTVTMTLCGHGIGVGHLALAFSAESGTERSDLPATPGVEAL